MDTTDALLQVRGLRAGYAGRPVIFDVDLDVAAGEVVALLGSNGAGKTTVLNAVIGLVRRLAGTVMLARSPWDGYRPHLAVSAGMGLVPAERFTFPGLSVAESLALGARHLAAADRAAAVDRVIGLFPRLGERLTQAAVTMSGGEQRMLSVAVALLPRPRLLLLDEPSLGLSPAVAEHLNRTLRALADDTNLGILVVEQNVRQALSIADRAYVLRSGRVIQTESADEFRQRTDWWSLF